MKAGIMQPYFFPYLGYYSLIKHTDVFVLLDTVQFIRHGWIERNRILKQKDGWQYLKVPLVKPDGRSTLIKDIQIDNRENWKGKIVAQLTHYKKRAPFFKQSMGLLESVFQDEFESIVDFNLKSLKKVCQYLHIPAEIQVFSEMNLTIEEVNAPDEWALNICKAMNQIDEYWNPTGGLTFFDREKYQNANVCIKFHSVNLQPYSQRSSAFESGLSIIDVLMFNDVQAIHQMLDDYQLI